MAEVCIDEEVEVDLTQAIAELRPNDLLRIRGVVDTGLREAFGNEAVSSEERLKQLVLEQCGKRDEAIKVTVQEEIWVDVDEAVGALIGCIDDGFMEQLYYAVRDGDREKVFEMARTLCMEALGRVC